MLPIDIPFPHVGSHCFERETGRKLTVLQQRRDGRLLCRRDDRPKPSWTRTGPASGTRTFETDEVVETIEQTGFAAPESSRTIAGKPRVSRQAKRPARTNGGAL